LIVTPIFQKCICVRHSPWQGAGIDFFSGGPTAQPGLPHDSIRQRPHSYIAFYFGETGITSGAIAVNIIKDLLVGKKIAMQVFLSLIGSAVFEKQIDS